MSAVRYAIYCDSFYRTAEGEWSENVERALTYPTRFEACLMLEALDNDNYAVCEITEGDDE